MSVAIGACDSDNDASADRQAVVAERGADVMPFELDKTTHRFEPNDDGLVQAVVADDSRDTDQIELIREHLISERERFQAGDYGDPAQIHGEDMPGLDELEAGAANVVVEYDELSDGAQLTFTSNDPELVQALHDWGDAQDTDHGAHAEGPATTVPR